MQLSFLSTGLETFKKQPGHVKASLVFSLVLAAALFTTVALTNVAVLLLLLTAPFAWHAHLKSRQGLETPALHFLMLLGAFSIWDVFTNLHAGHGLGDSLQALLNEMRPLAFVMVLWAVFANPLVARVTFWALLAWVLYLATANLLLTLTGHVPQGQYFTTRFSHLSHVYGQALVGMVFVLAQVCLVKPRWFWRAAVPLVLLVLSLFLASERRTGWLLLAAGVFVWAGLNSQRLFVGRYKWWVVLASLAALLIALNSQIVQTRMALVLTEANHYLSLTPEQRSAAVFGSTSLRLHYVTTIWEAIQHSNWWTGVGSIDLAKAYQAAATRMGVTPQAWAGFNWENPHNEYLFMWATKGLVGLALYLAIFAQACRVAWRKTDEVQRVGLVMFVFLFMLSITANSMVIDMEEGHFAMLILLIFLAPKSLGLLESGEPGEKARA